MAPQRVLVFVAVIALVLGLGGGLAGGALMNAVATGGPGSGEAGAAGADGAEGPAGADGVDGVDGRDGRDGADGVDGRNGAPGAPGPVGPAGPRGLAGVDGADGVNGADGADGAPGVAGPRGAQGASGADGVDGSEGPMGPAGPQGPTGPAGPQGETGPAGPQGAAGLVPSATLALELTATSDTRGGFLLSAVGPSEGEVPIVALTPTRFQITEGGVYRISVGALINAGLETGTYRLSVERELEGYGATNILVDTVIEDQILGLGTTTITGDAVYYAPQGWEFSVGLAEEAGRTINLASAVLVVEKID